MPLKCSNIPSKILYSSIGAEILRTTQTSITLAAFESLSNFFLIECVDKVRTLEHEEHLGRCTTDTVNLVKMLNVL